MNVVLSARQYKSDSSPRLQEVLAQEERSSAVTSKGLAVAVKTTTKSHGFFCFCFLLIQYFYWGVSLPTSIS